MCTKLVNMRIGTADFVEKLGYKRLYSIEGSNPSLPTKLKYKLNRKYYYEKLTETQIITVNLALTF
jgi:hypothetical protein